jgi:hypothetical protein
MDTINRQQLAQNVLDATSACPEFKETAKAYLDAKGSAKEDEMWERLVAEAKEDITGIDDVLAFFRSEAGAAHFGAEVAKSLAAHAEEVKAAGGVYCDCPGCTAAKAIIDAEAEK